MAVQLWKHLPGKALMFLLNLFTAIALIFEGYNQGVLGTVSTTPGFIDMARIGSNGVVTDSTKQGGLLAAYYFGAMWACFIGGTDKSLQHPFFISSALILMDGKRLGRRQARPQKRRLDRLTLLHARRGAHDRQSKQ
jgi:hypothetical protein